MRTLTIALALLLVGSGIASAQATVITQPVVRAPQPNPAGWGWGAAATFRGNFVGADRVHDADDVFVNSFGNVELSREFNVQPAFTVETHQTYTLPFWGRRVAVGPFVNVVPGDNLFSAAGTGIVFELMSEQRYDQIQNRWTQGPSMTIGIGVLVDFDATVLNDGVFPGEPPETDLLSIQKHTSAFQMWVGIGL